MCGRFAVGDPEVDLWEGWLEISGAATAGPEPIWPEPNWNVAPTQIAAILVANEGRRMVTARWGLIPRWWRKPLSEMKASTFNARSEEASQKPMFRDAWRVGRCLVPALGYYEWSGKKGAKTPWFVTLERNTPGICFAGLWAEATVDGALLRSFTILTCAAGKATQHLHPRSPVILDEQDWEEWLSAEGSEPPMSAPPDGRVRVHEVDARVGNVRNNGPELIEPVGLGL
ncbi:MAG: SOS response-associated peptidase [Pseudomonadota bacterium]